MAIKYWNLANLGGNWNTASNWNPSGVPLAGDDVFVTGSVTAARSIIYNTASAINSLSFANQTGTLNSWTVGGVNPTTLSTVSWAYPSGAYIYADSTLSTATPSGAPTVTLAMSSSQALRKTGPGLIHFSTTGNNNWVGGIIVETGSLGYWNASNVFGSGPITLLSGTTFGGYTSTVTSQGNNIVVNGPATIYNSGSGAQTLTGSVTVNNTTASIGTNSGGLLFTGAILGSSSLINFIGAGTDIRFTGASTITGSMNINSPRVTFGNRYAYPALPTISSNLFPAISNISIASASVLELQTNTSYTVPHTFSGQGGVQIWGTAGRVLTFKQGALANLTGSPDISSALLGTFHARNGLEMYFDNTLTGIAADVKDLPGTLNYAFYCNLATVTSGTYIYTGPGGTFNTNIRVINVGSAGLAYPSSATSLLTANHTGSTPLIISGTIERAGATNAASTNLVLNGTSTADNEIRGGILNNSYGDFTLTKSGVGKWILGTANTYTGDTRLSAGTLEIQNILSLQSSSLNLATGDTGRLVFGGITSATFGSIYGSRNLALTNSAGQNLTSLTVGADNKTSTYSGILSGSSNLVKNGTGTFTLSGINQYNGDTYINGGGITVTADSGLGSNTAANLFLSGTTFTNSSTAFTTNRSITITSGTSNAINGAITVNNNIVGGGNLSHTTGELILKGNSNNFNILTNAASAILTATGSITASAFTSSNASYTYLNSQNNIASIYTDGGNVTANHINALNSVQNIRLTTNGYPQIVYNNITGTIVMNANFAADAGMTGFIRINDGANYTYNGTFSGGAATANDWFVHDNKNGIITLTSASAYLGQTHIIPGWSENYTQPMTNNIGTTIMRDLTANASGIGGQAMGLAGGAIYEMSASLFTRTMGIAANNFYVRGRTYTSLNSTTTPQAEADKGAGFSSINPSGTTITTPVTFIPATSTGASFWPGEFIVGTSRNTSTGKIKFTGAMNLNGTSQDFYIFNGATASGSVAEIAGVVAGTTTAGILNKLGPGKLMLTAKNTYIGPTKVINGTLEANYLGLQVGSGSLTVGGTISVNSGSTYRYIGSGSQTYATINLSSGSNTFSVDSAAGAYFPTMSLGSATSITGSAAQAVIIEVASLSATGDMNLSGSNSWKVSGLNASRTGNTTLLNGSKLILNTEYVGEGVSLGTGTTTVKAGAIIETISGVSQSGKAKYNGSLTLGTAGGGTLKAKYKIGDRRNAYRGTTFINGNFNIGGVTNVRISNSQIYNGPGTYIAFEYTGTCTNFHNLYFTTSISGRYISHTYHDAINKRIYVTLN